MTKHSMLTQHGVIKNNAIYDDKTQHANTAFVIINDIYNDKTQYAVVKKNAIYDDKTQPANTACCG